MVLKLQGFPFSTCSNRVSIVLAEKEVEVEFTAIDISKGEHKTEAYIANSHPFAKVPVFEDSEAGIKIFESRAIAQYVATKYSSQGAALIPAQSDLKAYALYLQGLSIEQSYFDPLVSAIAFEKVFKPMKGFGETDEARVKTLVAQLDTTLEGYERVLSKQAFIGGDKLTLVDLFHLPYGAFVEPFGFAELLNKYPATKKWWEALKERESWKKISAK